MELKIEYNMHQISHWLSKTLHALGQQYFEFPLALDRSKQTFKRKSSVWNSAENSIWCEDYDVLLPSAEVQTKPLVLETLIYETLI